MFQIIHSILKCYFDIVLILEILKYYFVTPILDYVIYTQPNKYQVDIRYEYVLDTVREHIEYATWRVDDRCI
jgi:hypothetical protein